MLRHRRTVRPPPSVTVLPLPYNHRVSVLLPLGTHLSSLSPSLSLPSSRFPTLFLTRPPARPPARPSSRVLPVEFHTHARHTLAAQRQRGNILEFSHGRQDEIPASFSPPLPLSSWSSPSPTTRATTTMTMTTGSSLLASSLFLSFSFSFFYYLLARAR